MNHHDTALIQPATGAPATGPSYRDHAERRGDDGVLEAFLAAAGELEAPTTGAAPRGAARTEAGEPATHQAPASRSRAGSQGPTPIVRGTTVPKGADNGPGDAVEADPAVQHPSCPARQTGVSETRKTATPKGYLISSYYGSVSQRRYVDGLLDGFSEAQRRFWLHVMISGVVQERSSTEMVPVASALMLEKLPDCPHKTEEMWGPLAEAGLLLVDADYSIVKGETREFRVPHPLTLAFIDAGAEAQNKKGYEVFSGKRTRSPKLAEKTTRHDEQRNPYPELLDGVLRHFQAVRRDVNKTAVERHLRIRQARLDEAEEAWEAAGSPDEGPVQDAYAGALGVLVNDRHCFEVIQKQDWRFERVVEDGEVWSYVPAYGVQELSGRLTEKMGGMQSASRPMKGASVVGTSQVNYDVVSSQLYALLQAFEEAGIDAAPVVGLLDQDKADIAAGIGVTVDTYKVCLYALLFHAGLFPSLGMALDISPDGAVVQTILDDPTDDKHGAYRRLYETMAPLRKGLRRWHRWLTTTYWERVSRAGYAVNDCGVTFRLSDYEPGHERTSKMAAWYLQGKEACYVHHLTLLGEKYGYTVVANEHDGVLSDGEIPPEAIAEALALADFTHARLTTKPIGTPLWNDPTTSSTNSTSSTTSRTPTTPTGTSPGTRSERSGDRATSRTSSARMPSATGRPRPAAAPSVGSAPATPSAAA